MKVYLASRFSRREELAEYAAQLEAAGIEVTSRWLKGGHQISDDQLNDGAAELALGARYAMEDTLDLAAADCCVFFSEEPRSTSSRGGRHVEYGITLMGNIIGERKRRILLVGPRENVFMCHPSVEQFSSFHDCFLELVRGLPARQLAALQARASAPLVYEHAEFAALVELVEDYEQWEADLIEDNEAWEPDGMADFPRLTQALYDRMMELQEKRNALLSRIQAAAQLNLEAPNSERKEVSTMHFGPEPVPTPDPDPAPPTPSE